MYGGASSLLISLISVLSKFPILVALNKLSKGNPCNQECHGKTHQINSHLVDREEIVRLTLIVKSSPSNKNLRASSSYTVYELVPLKKVG